MAVTADVYTLENANHTLRFNPASGRLVSYRNKAAPDLEFIVSQENHPVFVIDYLDTQRQFHQLTSFDAAEKRIELSPDRTTLTLSFAKIKNFDLSLTITAKTNPQDRYTRWSLSVNNNANQEIVGVQFPFVVLRYDLEGTPGTRCLINPYDLGMCVKEPQLWTPGPMWGAPIPADHPLTWQSTKVYPGFQIAQFLAYYNDKSGIYIACDDSQANVKLIKPVHRHPGLRLGFSHIGDWPTHGSRTLEYAVLMTGFQGDWYTAADLYRDWSLQQSWATPLHKRKDIPNWLLECPVHITFRMQGELDAGPPFPVKEFLPYEKCIPLLEALVKRIEAPVVPTIMSWERGGPWVYPDCFPPVGGDESIRNFVKMARDRGWHVGSFCNGTRWVVEHFWAEYDGWPYFKEHNGEQSLCQKPDHSYWQDDWDASWRPSFRQCMGTAMTRQIAADFVERLVGWGLESIQFFDQNNCAEIYPCYAHDHEHPPVPGKWLVQKMAQLMDQFNQVARNANQPGVIHSVERPCNEACLPLFQLCDVRLPPPDHCVDPHFIPLFHYLYHECIVLNGMMGFGQDPYQLQIHNACNFVMGENCGAVMMGDGRLLNRDTVNWAAWSESLGGPQGDENALAVLHAAATLRRGAGKDYLLFGRMQRPIEWTGIQILDWEFPDRVINRINHVPAVFHAAWTNPKGKFAVALANWTTTPQTLHTTDPRIAGTHTLRLTLSTGNPETRPLENAKQLTLTLPPLSCALLEVE